MRCDLLSLGEGQDAEPDASVATQALQAADGHCAPELQQASPSTEAGSAMPQTSEPQAAPGLESEAQPSAAHPSAANGAEAVADADASHKAAEAAAEAADAGDAAAQPAAGTAQATDAAGSAAQPLSKNQQKKLRKAERRQELRALRKAEEKAQKAAAQEARKAEGKARLDGMTEEEKAAARAVKAARLEARRQHTADKRARQEKALVSGQRVVIDLDFEGLMTPAELSSICNQLMHSYSANSRAAMPCHLHFTSVTGAVQQQIQRQLAGFDKWKVTRSSISYMDLFAGEQQRLVYLTADSDTELAQLDPQDVYIIGGLVDRNRHKNICRERAEQQGIRTARLPISGRVQLTSSTVLTVNQVVDIMLEYLNTSDWCAALEKVIPARKRGGGGGEVGSGEAKRARTD